MYAYIHYPTQQYQFCLPLPHVQSTFCGHHALSLPAIEVVSIMALIHTESSLSTRWILHQDSFSKYCNISAAGHIAGCWVQNEKGYLISFVQLPKVVGEAPSMHICVTLGPNCRPLIYLWPSRYWQSTKNVFKLYFMWRHLPQPSAHRKKRRSSSWTLELSRRLSVHPHSASSQPD